MLALAIDPQTPTTLYAGTWGSGVFSTWQAKPELNINYNSGAPGSFFTLTGVYFPPDSTATIQVNGQILGAVNTDGGGSFTFVLDTANADVGAYFVTTTVNPSATARFTLESSEPVRPQEGGGPVFDVSAGIALTEFVFLPLVIR